MAPPNKYKGLREAIVFNETKFGTADYKTADQIAKDFGCSTAYVYRVRYLLGFKIPNLKLKNPPPSDPTERVTSTGALEDLLSEPLISQVDRLKILSRLIRTGAPQVKIAAIKAMEDLTKTSDDRVGPGPPLTDADKISRLARLLLALPEEISSQAWEVAYGTRPQKSADRAAVPATLEILPSTTGPVPEPLHDLPIPTFPQAVSRSRPQPQDDDSPGDSL